MRRLAFVVAAAAIAGLAALPAGAAPERLSFVQVVEKEFTLTLSRQSVRTGSVSVELVNFGMDNHDLVIKSVKPGSTPIRFKQLAPRGRAERTLRVDARALLALVLDLQPQGTRDARDPRRDPVTVKESRSRAIRADLMATIPRYSGPFGTAAGRASPLARRVRTSPRRGREPRPARSGRRRPLAHAPARRALDRAARRTTTRAARSRPPTRGATTISGGSTGWCGRAGRSSSG